MRRALAAFALALAAAASAPAQTAAPRTGAQTGRAAPKAGPRTPADAARQEMNLGARAYRAGRYTEAEQHFRRALELNPAEKNAPLYAARAVQQQYKPGVETPENVAAGERAVAVYQELLAKDPLNEEAYQAVILLHGQMKQEQRVGEFLLQRANNFSLPNPKRAAAFSALAAARLECSRGVTERPENKKTTEGQNGAPPATAYTMPSDAGDHIRARQCVTDGLQFAEQAVALDPASRGTRALRGNLLREAAKLAEMEGDAAQKAEYERQYREALGIPPGAAADEPLAVVAPTASPESGEKRRTIVSGGVLNGKAVSKPEPEYPEAARAAGAEGTVTVQIVVDEEGNVVSASAISGHPLLQQAAIAAARQARFSPTLLSGQPVRVTGVVTYRFTLR